MINSFKRNVDFFKSILQEKNRKRCMEKLLHASKDQVHVEHVEEKDTFITAHRCQTQEI